MLNNMIWESIKTPLRQGLLFVYALVVTNLLDLAFTFIINFFGFDLLPEQKTAISTKLLGFGAPIAYGILAAIDNLLHKIGKTKETLGEPSKLVTGLTRF